MNGLGARVLLLVAVVAFASLLAQAAASKVARKVRNIDYRLERSILPSFYSLTIRVLGNVDDPGTYFGGEVDITLQAQDQTNLSQITLHKDGIDIRGTRLYDQMGQLVETIDSDALTYDETRMKLTVQLTNPLTPLTNYTLYFNYTGKIRNDMTGLFASSYTEEATGNTKWMLLTQLQRIYARRLLPCFDEPALKARFEVRISRASDVMALSNTKRISTTAEGNNRFMDHFEITPPMSTYLLAIFVADYKARGDINDFAIVTRPEAYNDTEFSYDIGQSLLKGFANQFKMTYEELGNQVLVQAASQLFPYNGMENWGLILYREPQLVLVPYYSDGWKDKETSVRIMAHEMSHMWFGNSVTCSWWSHFWLNEAFARYFEYFMAHQTHPEYHLDEQFVVRQLQLIFRTDSKASTQPMTSPESSINTPSQLGYKFSSITYAKGASVVRMWRNAMGVDNFDNAIQSYLRKYHLDSTEPKHLFAELKNYWPKDPKVDLDQFFTDFTEQVGYPLLTVKLSSSNDRVTMTQNRFLSSPSDGSDDSIRYTIPITYATNLMPNFTNLTPHKYFNKHSDSLEIEFNKDIDWIIVNLKQSNYHRVMYDNNLLRRIQDALTETNHSRIPAENRAQIIDDLFHLASVGYIDIVKVFEFMEYMKTDIDYVPWYAAYYGMDTIALRFNPLQALNFQKYLSDITDASHKRLGVGWSDKDTPTDVFLRDKQVAWLCKYQDPKCIEHVKQLFETNPEVPSPDYRETFYCAAAREGGYKRIMDYYRKETVDSEKELLWRAASCTRDYRTHYYFEILSTEKSVEFKQLGLSYLYKQNPDLVTEVFQTATEDVTLLAASLNSWELAAKALSDMSNYFTMLGQKMLFAEFIEVNQELFGSSASILTDALQNVNNNLEWAEKNLANLGKYLAERNGASHMGVTSLLVLLVSVFLNL